MSCCTLIAFPKDGLSRETNLEKNRNRAREWKCESESFQYSAGVYPAVMHSQQREEAHVSVCLVAGDTGLSLHKLATRVIFDRGEKVMSTYAHLGVRWRGGDGGVAQGSSSGLVCPKLTEVYVFTCFCARDEYDITSLPISVYCHGLQECQVVCLEERSFNWLLAA